MKNTFRSLTIHDDKVNKADRSEHVCWPLSQSTLGSAKVELEREKIMAAVKTAQGSVTEVARILGVSRMTAYRKLKRYQIILESFRGES
jgi:transcriptional regulator of acetoin/glycerol metabolism